MRLIESFITSATLEVRLMPGIDLDLASQMAQVMLAEIKDNHRSYGAEAHVISRDDHLSISIEYVEIEEMTASAYGQVLDKLRHIVQAMAPEE